MTDNYQTYRTPCGNERGVALITALLLLAVLSVLGTTAYLTSSVEVKIAGNYKTSKIAFYAAEAGLEEARHRLNLDADDTNYIGEAVGATPTAGWGRYVVRQSGDSDAAYTELTTLQTVDGTEIDYLVKIYYKLEDSTYNNGTDNDEVVLYGTDFGYGGDAPATGTFPVIVIESTGSGGNNSSSTVTVEVTKLSLDITAKSALACDGSPSLGGSTFISGFNHDVSTTSADDSKSSTDITGADLPFDGNNIDNHGGKEVHNSGNADDSDTSLQPGEDTIDTNPRLDEVDVLYGAKIKNDLSTHLPGVWTTGDAVSQSGTDDIYGGNDFEPWKNESSGNTWLTLAQLLGLSDNEIQTVLNNADVTMADTSVSGGNLWLNTAPEGITYINNAGGSQLKISSSTTGYGLMYVTGDLDANNLTFKGLIYVEGTISLGAQFWLLGAMTTKGGNPGASGGGNILYSKDALDQKVGESMKYFTLSWVDDKFLP